MYLDSNPVFPLFAVCISPHYPKNTLIARQQVELAKNVCKSPSFLHYWKLMIRQQICTRLEGTAGARMSCSALALSSSNGLVEQDQQKITEGSRSIPQSLSLYQSTSQCMAMFIAVKNGQKPETPVCQKETKSSPDFSTMNHKERKPVLKSCTFPVGIPGPWVEGELW